MTKNFWPVNRKKPTFLQNWMNPKEDNLFKLCFKIIQTSQNPRQRGKNEIKDNVTLPIGKKRNDSIFLMGNHGSQKE